MIREVFGVYERIDVLVNNAGITRDKSIRKMTDGDWSEVIDINLNSAFYCTSAALPYMIERNFGRIVNVASFVGQAGNFGQANYAASKGGLIAFTKVLNDRNAKDPVIALITEWTTSEGAVEQRHDGSDLGGTMRLGSQECRLKPGTLAHELYGQDVIRERHRHRYEFNNRYRQRFEELGLVISGVSMDGLLVEMIELPRAKHPWFLACQAHPEFTSTPRDGHPLFSGFVQAAREYQAVREAPVLATAKVAS